MGNPRKIAIEAVRRANGGRLVTNVMETKEWFCKEGDIGYRPLWPKGSKKITLMEWTQGSLDCLVESGGDQYYQSAKDIYKTGDEANQASLRTYEMYTPKQRKLADAILAGEDIRKLEV